MCSKQVERIKHGLGMRFITQSIAAGGDEDKGRVRTARKDAGRNVCDDFQEKIMGERMSDMRKNGS